MLGWVVRSACSRAAVSVAAAVARHDCNVFLLCSLLPSLAAARCGKVQTMLQCRCCFVSAASAILVFAVASDCRAASDAAVTSARHVCCDCASF